MTKILSCTAVLGLLVASSSGVLAKGPGGSMGASSFSPGHQFRTADGPPTTGPTAGYPGASGYAPGRLYIGNGRSSAGPGASDYAPGVYAPGFLK
jgi:hypothetical protein